MKKSVVLSVLMSLVFMLGCAPSASQLKKVIEENPDVVFSAIEKDPKQFIEVVNKAARQAQVQAREDEEKAASAAMEEEFKNPKQPKVDEDRAIFGPKTAAITIVEYSDFECPYCTRGYETMKEVRKAYGDKVRILYKHLPLDFHPLALPAAQYFEAIALQDKAKAEKFHDMIFENQGELKSKGKAYFDTAAKKVGADLARVKKDLESEKVQSRIASDMEEAKGFGFSGTPGFLVNGVSVRGAYPFPEFKKIIDRHLEGK